MKKCRIGNAFPMGATVINSKAVQFVTKVNKKKNKGLVLYDKKTGEREEYALTEEFQIGNVYSIILEDMSYDKYTYNFIENGKEIRDPYAKVICGNESWGDAERTLVSAGIGAKKFDWEDDQVLMIPYQDSIIYQLHVRGFTKHISSGVKKKGTFEGVCEKISYLKSLGITAVELLPSYDFEECEKEMPGIMTMDYVKENYTNPPSNKVVNKINYWGYKEASYFSPKSSYSAGKNPIYSFKNMVKEFHKAGIEVIMQFYFPQTVERAYIIDVIKYWVKEYHIDGVHLLGVNIPISILATQSELCNTKILYEYINQNEVYDYNYVPAYHNLASYNEGYMYALRKFLKGDVGSLQKAFQAMVNMPKQVSNIVYFTNYNTFTLKDLVSFERKHNEQNGENGKDGNNNNVSWNCGVEGITKKKNVVALREQQMRNAMTLLMLSKGTPVILAGDEFGNSQNGNNNPYCQDNPVSWLNWKDLTKNQQHYEFTKKMIAMIKERKILKKQVEKGTRRTGVEYPYMSFHGTEAWKLDWSAANEEAGGILYYDNYQYVYIGINMYWQAATLALPNIPGKHKWELLLDTAKEENDIWDEEEHKTIHMPARSIKIITAQGSKDDFNENLSAF